MNVNVYLSFDEWLCNNQLSLWSNHDFLLEIALFLNKEFNAKIIHSNNKPLYLEEFGHEMCDCEIIIYDNENDILKCFSFSETRPKLYDVFVKRNNVNDIMVISHLDHWGLEHIHKSNFNFKIKRSAFQPYSPLINHDYFYRMRQFIKPENFIDQMFFRCSTGRADEYELHDSKYVNDRFPPISIEKYLYKAIHYKVGLAISNNVGICHRDIDYMSIGLPLMRVEYHGSYEPELIPNYHYISINKTGLSNSSVEDLKGGSKFIKAYFDKFMEIKDDYTLLEKISKNAKKYYDDNCHLFTRLNIMLNNLEIKKL